MNKTRLTKKWFGDCELDEGKFIDEAWIKANNPSVITAMNMFSDLNQLVKPFFMNEEISAEMQPYALLVLGMFYLHAETLGESQNARD